MIRFVLFFVLLVAPMTAVAQPFVSNEKDGEITAAPICSAIVNRSGQTMIGTLSTAGQPNGNGDIVKNEENFRMLNGERKEFCSTGPFYAGQRLRVVLRTLLPLFDCKTKIDHVIYLDALPDKYGFKHLSATCD